jgi:hypothetical protein
MDYFQNLWQNTLDMEVEISKIWGLWGENLGVYLLK